MNSISKAHTTVNRRQQLGREDLARVDKYLNSPNHRIERKPFRPWLLLGIIVLIMTSLSVFSYFLAWSHGVV